MARRKITAPDNNAVIDDQDDLPELTQQQYAFVAAVLSGKSGADAYRTAYDCTSMSPNAVWVEASRARSHPKISLWLAQARKAGLGAAVVTLQGHIQELERLREVALETGNVGAAVQAEQLRGKASGHYVERYADVTETDPMRALEEIDKLNPTLASELAKQHGIQWKH